jgi:hypothetical protein
MSSNPASVGIPLTGDLQRPDYMRYRTFDEKRDTGWAIYSFDLITGKLITPLPFESMDMELTYSGVGDMNISFRNGHPYITPSTIRSHETGLAVERNGQLLSAMYVEDIKANNKTVQVKGPDLLGYLFRRMLDSSKFYNQVDQLLVARDLIMWTQGKADVELGGGDEGNGPGIPFDVMYRQASGVLVTEEYSELELPLVGSLMQELGQREQGFDFRLKLEWVDEKTAIRAVIYLDYPLTGLVTDHRLKLGVNIKSDYSIDTAGKNQSNAVFAVGSELYGIKPMVEVVDSNSFVRMPRVDTAVVFNSAYSEDDLAGRAPAVLEAYRFAPRFLSVNMEEGMHPMVGEVYNGDIVHVEIDDGYNRVEGTPWRITTQGVSIGTEGEENHSLSLQELVAYRGGE